VPIAAPTAPFITTILPMYCCFNGHICRLEPVQFWQELG
jgi:hypothetical protein